MIQFRVDQRARRGIAVRSTFSSRSSPHSRCSALSARPQVLGPATRSSSPCLLRVREPAEHDQDRRADQGWVRQHRQRISVKIVDPNSGQTVDSNANVTLALASTRRAAPEWRRDGSGRRRGHIPRLSIGRRGRTSSARAALSHRTRRVEPVHGFGHRHRMREGRVALHGAEAENSYTVTPKKGTPARTTSPPESPGLNISCDFAPYNYPASRQPNSVWYVYDDGPTSRSKTNVIVIPATSSRSHQRTVRRSTASATPPLFGSGIGTANARQADQHSNRRPERRTSA